MDVVALRLLTSLSTSTTSSNMFRPSATQPSASPEHRPLYDSYVTGELSVSNSVLSVAVEALRVSESMTITLENSAMASHPSRLGSVCPAMTFGQAAGHWSVTYCLLLVWASPYCAASRTGILKSFRERLGKILLPNPFFGELPLFVPLSRPLAVRTQ
jgi:hypothetical protein